MKAFSALLTLVAIFQSYREALAVVIQTKSGQIEGLESTSGGKKLYQFLGIPFAEPPVGPLRFRKPQAKGSWEGILDATKFGSACMQQESALPLLNGISEDCLYLNVYVPTELSPSKPKSVMVWVHGGGFTNGEGSVYDASHLSLLGDVIVVTINYRLGYFGFLSTLDSASPGNYGLWDQHLAILWTKENITEFGGDPMSITLFGESAGAFSVGLHSLAPVNKGLFQRAIVESGAPTSPWVAPDKSIVLAVKAMASHVGCLAVGSSEAMSEVVDCLRNVNASVLLEAAGLPVIDPADRSFVTQLTIAPVIDNDFLTDSPQSIIKNADSAEYSMFVGIDLLAGTNNADGSVYLAAVQAFQPVWGFNFSEGISSTLLCEKVIPTFALKSYANHAGASKAICNKYTMDTDDLREQSQKVVNFFSDMMFIAPTVTYLRGHAQKGSGSTYQYQLSYQPYLHTLLVAEWVQGAGHAEELQFLFPSFVIPYFEDNKPEAEVTLTSQFSMYWTNFAKHGDPNDPELPRWPQFDTESQHYLDIDEHVTSNTTLLEHRVKFWNYDLPNLIAPATTSGSSTCTPESVLTVTLLFAAVFTLK